MKRIFFGSALTAVMALLVLMFTSGGGAQRSSGASGSAALLAPGTPVTITYWYPLNAGSNTAEQLIDGIGMKKVQEITGVTINWEVIPAAGTDERYNLLMASGDLPDVVAYNIRGLKQYFQAFQPIDGLIKNNLNRYPNLHKYFFNDEYLDAYLTNDDGLLRIVPMLATRRTGDILIIRQDLLQKYNGGRSPVTVDDWYQLLTAAKNDGKIGVAILLPVLSSILFPVIIKS